MVYGTACRASTDLRHPFGRFELQPRDLRVGGRCPRCWKKNAVESVSARPKAVVDQLGDRVQREGSFRRARHEPGCRGRRGSRDEPLPVQDLARPEAAEE